MREARVRRRATKTPHWLPLTVIMFLGTMMMLGQSEARPSEAARSGGPEPIAGAFYPTPGAAIPNVRTFANVTPIRIPATGDGTPLFGSPADPYPSVIEVVGVTGAVTKVTATLKGLTHTFPDDVDVLLVGPGGQKLLLMSDTGEATDVVEATLTFDDGAANSLPDGAVPPITTGVYRPTNFVGSDRFPAPAPAGPYPDPQLLSVFNAIDPNGTWRLFVSDDGATNTGSISGGWELAITTEDSLVPCTLTCPADIKVDNDFGSCGAFVTFSVEPSGSCSPVTYSHEPGSFFNVGTTAVRASAMQSDGSMVSCTFNVKVVDGEKPSLTSSVATSSLWPNNFDLVNVGLAADARDNCSTISSIEVQVYSNEDDLVTDSDVWSPDAKEIELGTLLLRAERNGKGNGRVYLIVIKATDLRGNSVYDVQTVVVPKSQSAAHINAVEAMARAARTFFMDMQKPPEGYFAVGDGPIVGPKQ